MAGKENNPGRKKDPLICFCNGVSQRQIEIAIERGCNTLPKIFDATRAGVGPCGGSCRPYLARMLEQFLKTGRFPANPRKKEK